ncbi:Threonine/homoserine/homoserine lactone efflux protein [Sulfitobacter marinus]|uniref:Threonine/homoserine/homoserine lactone efflux protein n=1 Tax=Sulfitobacter marinus TaxID=394264 RepID=A0A1I6U127_9RHOB|nr:LysE family translocator [Sulfitobacter marinus]SFS95122.1 Threonine/homoserine/homoserine lactone efflux protein [Sulfitobacter marinus]
MTFDVLSALALFAFITSMTPGPNNLMLMASGANYGFARTVPHMLGITIGFMIMLLLVGFGLIRVFDTFPVIYTVLKVLSVIYLLYLAYKIATAGPAQQAAATGHPLSFIQAAGFQWVNPKAWAFGLSIITIYVPQADAGPLFITAGVVAVMAFPSVTLWTVLGKEMARFLTNPRRLTIFNWTMAALLVASLVPVLLPAA